MKDIEAAWQVAQFTDFEPAAKSVYESMQKHSWFIDGPTVIFALANSDGSVPDCQKKALAKALVNQPRTGEYNITTDFVESKDLLPDLQEMRNLAEPPCLSRFITSDSWIIFDYLKHGDSEVKWLNYPVAVWPCDKDYKRFQSFIKKLAVVNDCSERAVQKIQSIVDLAKSEDKLQKMLGVTMRKEDI